MYSYACTVRSCMLVYCTLEYCCFVRMSVHSICALECCVAGKCAVNHFQPGAYLKHLPNVSKELKERKKVLCRELGENVWEKNVNPPISNDISKYPI